MRGIDQNALARLLDLRQDNNEAAERMTAQAERFRLLTGAKPQAISAFNLFQTPKAIAAQMAAIVQDKVAGGRILEPSVGLARLVEPLEGLEADWLLIENAFECLRAVRDAVNMANKKAMHRDFLTVEPSETGLFDAVIMNPPFKQGRDIKHIEHATRFLAPGGKLVSLCYNGVRQNEILKPLADTWEVLQEKSFKEEGTNASVAMLIINKI